MRDRPWLRLSMSRNTDRPAVPGLSTVENLEREDMMADAFLQPAKDKKSSTMFGLLVDLWHFVCSHEMALLAVSAVVSLVAER